MFFTSFFIKKRGTLPNCCQCYELCKHVRRASLLCDASVRSITLPKDAVFAFDEFDILIRITHLQLSDITI